MLLFLKAIRRRYKSMAQDLGLGDAIGELKDLLTTIYYKKFGYFQPLKKLLKTVENTMLY